MRTKINFIKIVFVQVLVQLLFHTLTNQVYAEQQNQNTTDFPDTVTESNDQHSSLIYDSIFLYLNTSNEEVSNNNSTEYTPSNVTSDFNTSHSNFSNKMDNEVICLLEPSYGECNDDITKFFFNSSSNSCEFFSYSGCGGNKNKFNSITECENKCLKIWLSDQESFIHNEPINVNMLSSNACNLLPDTGLCDDYVEKYFYNTTSKKCEIFLYGGCNGNGNRFDNFKTCEETCFVDINGKDLNICSQQPERGPCKGKFIRYFYNINNKNCEEFIYGGCEGNLNNFCDIKSCEKKCDKNFYINNEYPLSDINELPILCTLPPDRGMCMAEITKYFYNSLTNKCETFVYGGCQGNENKFDDLESCEKTCLPKKTDICGLPADRGMCMAYILKYFYNSLTNKCEIFVYGGCQGNDNKFDDLESCERACLKNIDIQTDICTLPADRGRCRGRYLKYFYNPNSKSCDVFEYGGCDGNENRFDDLETCEKTCSPKKTDICNLPADRGRCRGRYLKYFYNPITKSCDVFEYGGCDGNENRFDDLETCEKTCSQKETDICSLPADRGRCRGRYLKYFYNPNSKSCDVFEYGGCDGNENRFDDLETCEKTCSPKKTDICSLPADRGMCMAYILKYFYNSLTNKCETFVYGGCQGNDNKFDDLETCEKTCLSKKTDICNLPADRGRCRGRYLKYFYNPKSKSCDVFEYGGCDGNENRFDDKYTCEKTCIKKSNYMKNMCSLPPDTGPCKSKIFRYFFNTKTQKCQIFIYGGCKGNSNNFRSEEDCEDTCEPSDENEIRPKLCNLPPERGPCKAKIYRYYYNKRRDDCIRFIYSGCGGNSNNFRSEDECEDICD